jgi:hypothetical protein
MSGLALGLRAQRGGAVLVAVEAGPRLALSTFLATAAEGDRVAFEPYHVASAMPRDPTGAPSDDAIALAAEGRRRQDQLATEGLQAVVDRLGARPQVAALLVNRSIPIDDLLRYSLAYPEHAAVAEPMAVRDAVRHAARRCDVALAELDEKALPARAAEALGLASEQIDAQLAQFGAAAGRPWRKEQKLAALAAWSALAGLR